MLADDTGLLVNEIVDTVPRENLVKRLILHQGYLYVLQYLSSSDTSLGIRLQRYNATNLNLEFSESYTRYGSHQAMDMEILPDGRVAITFYETIPTCTGCTGLVVLDSAGCVPDWCVTNIKEIEAEKVTVYPNPFTTILSIANTSPVNATLLDFMGRPVLEWKNVLNETLQITTNIAEGIYFMQLNGIESRQTIKLIHTH